MIEDVSMDNSRYVSKKLQNRKKHPQATHGMGHIPPASHRAANFSEHSELTGSEVLMIWNDKRKAL